MTDRERIARAMHESLRADPRWADMEPFDPEYHKQYLWQATAALDAMLEPSEGALKAGGNVKAVQIGRNQPGKAARTIWQAMIRHILVHSGGGEGDEAN